jgi:hypothetical protein
VTAPAVDLLQQAGDGLAAACTEPAAPRRFAAAHRAALRGAAAVLAARAVPTSGREPGPSPAPSTGGRPTSAWELLRAVAPELGEWAQFFAACAPGPSGRPPAVSVRDADDMVRQVEQFLALAENAVRGRGPRRPDR